MIQALLLVADQNSVGYSKIGGVIYILTKQDCTELVYSFTIKSATCYLIKVWFDNGRETEPVKIQTL